MEPPSGFVAFHVSHMNTLVPHKWWRHELSPAKPMITSVTADWSYDEGYENGKCCKSLTVRKLREAIVTFNFDFVVASTKSALLVIG